MDPWTYLALDDAEDFVLCAALACYYHQLCRLPRQIQHRQRLYSGNAWVQHILSHEQDCINNSEDVPNDNSEDVPNDEDAVPHDETDVPLPHITPSPPLPRRTGSASSKRKRSDPMSSSVNFWDNLQNTFEHISETKIQKIRDSLGDSSKDAAINKKEEDDAEYEALMRELLDGGVDPWSTEYMMATEVLVDVTRRGAYRPLPSVAAKLNWIKHIYVMTKGQPPSV